ncbi:hypothetical protein NKH18_01250 [Streptomyces sp. M10(2022)]
MGWTLHLTQGVTHVLNISADYALPAAGCALTAGVISLTTRSKTGVIIFLSSLGLVTAMAVIPPAYFVGGALTLASLVAYRTVRGWPGTHANTWPWQAIAWSRSSPPPPPPSPPSSTARTETEQPAMNQIFGRSASPAPPSSRPHSSSSAPVATGRSNCPTKA